MVSKCMFDIVIQNAFQKYFSFENTLIFFSNSSSKPLESTKKINFMFFQVKNAFKIHLNTASNTKTSRQ